MRRPETPQVAVFFGGGPADGERRRVGDDDTTALVTDGGAVDASEAGAPARHRYVRQPDGRFRYDGIAEPEPAPPLLPELAEQDEHAHALAALRHDGGPHPVLIVVVVAVLAAAMYFFALYA